MEDTSDSNKIIYKILVVGESSVGKSSISHRFCKGTFLHEDKPTIGVDFWSKTVFVGGKEITMQIWDTAGQEQFRKSLIPNYYRNAHAVIIVYDVTVEATFDALSQWIEECDIHDVGDDKPRILIGNKCDGIQAVNLNVALRFANKHNMPLYQTSAKEDSDDVESIFLNLARALKAQKPFLESDVSKNTVVLFDPVPAVPVKKCWC